MADRGGFILEEYKLNVLFALEWALPANIRLFLPVPVNYNPKFKDWAYISLRYLEAFSKIKYPVKAVTTTGAGDLGDENSPWYQYAYMFTGDLVEKPKINLVLGFGGVFEKYWTLDMINIGMTCSYPRAARLEEIKDLKKYERVWAMTNRTKDDLAKLEIEADVMPPEPNILEAGLERYLIGE